MAHGRRIENDTLFAFAFDRGRERADSTRLEGLKRKVQELEATDITEQLRANEPATLGMSGRGQGLEQLFGFNTSGTAKVGRTWAPWLPGHSAHARLMDLAMGVAMESSGESR
eukprot:7008029-Prymnesium_polylepis.1